MCILYVRTVTRHCICLCMLYLLFPEHSFETWLWQLFHLLPCLTHHHWLLLDLLEPGLLLLHLHCQCLCPLVLVSEVHSLSWGVQHAKWGVFARCYNGSKFPIIVWILHTHHYAMSLEHACICIFCTHIPCTYSIRLTLCSSCLATKLHSQWLSVGCTGWASFTFLYQYGTVHMPDGIILYFCNKLPFDVKVASFLCQIKKRVSWVSNANLQLGYYFLFSVVLWSKPSNTLRDGAVSLLRTLPSTSMCSVPSSAAITVCVSLWVGGSVSDAVLQWYLVQPSTVCTAHVASKSESTYIVWCTQCRYCLTVVTSHITPPVCMFCSWLLAQLRLTLHCYDNNGYCYRNKCLCCGQCTLQQPRLLLRNENRLKLCPYISVRSIILALYGCPLHQIVFGRVISAIPMIVGRKMTEIVCAQWKHCFSAEIKWFCKHGMGLKQVTCSIAHRWLWQFHWQ